MTRIKLLENIVYDILIHKTKTTKSRSIIDISAQDTVLDALKLLYENSILSLAVYGEKGHWIGAGGNAVLKSDSNYMYIGIVTILDIVTFMIEQSDYYNYCFDSVRIVQVIGKSKETQSIWTCESTQPIYQAIEPMSKGVHRMIALFHSHSASNFSYLTQTDVISYILSKIESDPDIEKLVGHSIEFINESKVNHVTKHIEKLQYCTLKTPVWTAFKRMIMNSCTALPIIESENNPILLDTLSLSDLRPLCQMRDIPLTIRRLKTIPVDGFLKWFKQGSRIPITFTKNDSVYAVMHRLIKFKVHRAWSVDENDCVNGVISMTDLIDLVLKWHC